MSDIRHWRGRHWRTGREVTVSTQGCKIVVIKDAHKNSNQDQEMCRREDDETWLAPGMIDLQVNGIHGIDFNDPSMSIEQFSQAVRCLHAGGVVGFCPTVVTGERADMLRCLSNIAAACEADEAVSRSVVGIHVEGPFLSGEDGPRGAHAAKFVRDPDWSEFESWQQSSGDRIVKVTLAPERAGALDFIRRLKEQGVVAAIGHTSASEEVIRQAADAGATMSTHLGNGSHPLMKRHSNYVWAQLAEDRLWAGFIADGHHLPPAALQSMIRAKRDKALLVSDASHFEGFPPGRYLKRNQHEVVLRSDGRLHKAEDPDILSGAACPLHKGVENVVRFGICELGDAIELASLRPAQLLGLAPMRGTLEAGSDADLIRYRVDADNNLIILETVLAGETIYER